MKFDKLYNKCYLRERSRDHSRNFKNFSFNKLIKMTTRKITIKDIARKAEVSYQTVSRVLNDRPDVSEQTRARVWKIIDELEYRPSAAARSLRTNTTFTLGVLQNDITNSFYSNIVQGVEQVAIENGYSLILCNTNDDPERELHYIKMMQSKEVDGIIVSPTQPNSQFISQIAKKMPVVLVDRNIADADITAVVVDNEAGAHRATRYLIEQGHQHIGLITWEQKSPQVIGERVSGYRKALNEAGLIPDDMPSIYAPTQPPEDLVPLIEDLLINNPRVTALFALNNQLGLSVLMTIRKMKLRIPQDIAVVVFDDLPLFSLYSPAITVVQQPEAEIGKHAMQHLLGQISRNGDYVPETVTLKTELIIRDSV